jgi:hypothetical protein
MLILATLTLPSCICEDLSDCPDTRLLVMTDHELGVHGPDTRRVTETEITDWYDCIASVTVYVFDENDRFVTYWVGGAHTHGEDYEVPLEQLNLPEGVYTFVAWTNRNIDPSTPTIYECNVHEKVAGDPFADFRIRTVGFSDDGHLSDDFGHRHHGILRGVYVSHNSIRDEGRNILAIDPTVHKVNFTVIGLGHGDEADDTWSISVADSNREHNFDNKAVAGHDRYRHTHYMQLGDLNDSRAHDPRTRAEGDEGDEGAEGDGNTTMSTSLMMQQLQDATDTTITLRNEDTGEVLYTGDLINRIALGFGLVAGYAVDFERNLEFDVTFDFTGRMAIIVNIDGWTYRINDATIGK